jgi:hypothetical protein
VLLPVDHFANAVRFSYQRVVSDRTEGQQIIKWLSVSDYQRTLSFKQKQLMLA